MCRPRRISNLINLVIMGSTVGFVMETMDPYRGPAYGTFWFVTECICVGLFTVDFIVRAVTCPKFSEFSGDTMNWVDFVAIVPFYIERLFDIMGWDGAVLGNLRVIRVLRLARVLKILAKTSDGPSLEEGDGDDDVGAVIGEIVSNSFGALVIPIYFMWLTIVVFASVNYYIEKTEDKPVIHHCEDYSDLSTCSLEVPHGPMDSACPPVTDYNGLIDQSLSEENELMYMRGHVVGHPCTIQALLDHQLGAGMSTVADVTRCGLNAPETVEACSASDEATQCLLNEGSCTIAAAAGPVCSGTANPAGSCSDTSYSDQTSCESADCSGAACVWTDTTCDMSSGTCPTGCNFVPASSGPTSTNSCTYIPAAPAVTGKIGFTCEETTYKLMPGTTGLLNPDDAASSDMFPSIPHAIWWCIVTMTTVGYGDKYPLSWKGQVVGIMTASMGIFFISMPLSIVGSSFANSCDKLQGIQDQKDAVKAAEAHGYGSLSFLSKAHAPLIMKVRENCTPLDG